MTDVDPTPIYTPSIEGVEIEPINVEPGIVQDKTAPEGNWGN